MHKLYDLFRLPFKKGRILYTPDTGSALVPANMVFMSHLEGLLTRVDGSQEKYDLGSGLITNCGVNLMANDFTWGNGATLKQVNNQLTGTGTTAAAASDVFCQTPIGAGSLNGSTNGYVVGAQTYVSPNQWKNVAVFNYLATLAVTEWSIHIANAATVSATSAGSAPTNNHFIDTGASFNTTGQGLAAYTIEINSTIVNTPTTTVMGQILSNTSTNLTIQGPSGSSAWLTLANAVASVPGATVAYNVFPTAWDHKVFSAINVNSGDSINFTYTLTVNSGG